MDEITVVYGETAFTFPTDNAINHLDDCSAIESHKTIRDYINVTESKAPIGERAPAKSLVVDGTLTMRDSRLEDCLSAAFYIFKRNEAIEIVENEDADELQHIIAHIYNVSRNALSEDYDLEECDVILIEINEWECYPIAID